MYNLLSLLVALLASHGNAVGQGSFSLIGARAMGLGYASSCLSDEWSLFNNPAGIGNVKKLSVACTYDRAGVSSSFNRAAAGVTMPGKKIAAGLGFFRFGNTIYQEQIISAAAASIIGITSLGARISYARYVISGFGDKSAINIAFGGITSITERIHVGACISNLNQAYVSKTMKERIPTVLTAGLLFKASKIVSIVCEIEKDLEYKPTVKGGVEYIPHRKFTVRTGFNLNPQTAFIGFGFILKRFKADYAIQYLMDGGMRIQAGIIYAMKS